MSESAFVGDVDETVKLLRETGTELTSEVSAAVREIAKEGAELAAQKADEQGFSPPGRSGRGTGRLVEDIGSSVKGTTAFIRETASRGDFQYPRVYEFGHSHWGHRPFMVPAAEELRGEAQARVEEAVSTVVDKVNAA